MAKNEIRREELPYENRQVYDLMIEKVGKRNSSGFARLIGVSQQRIDRLFFTDKRSGKYPRVSDDIKQKIITTFHLPMDFFISYDINVPEEEKSISLDKLDPRILELFEGVGGLRKLLDMNIVNVPVVSAYAYAGYLAGYGDAEYIDSLPTVPFIPDRKMTGNYVAFEVRGDSMDDGTADSYKDGEILICREVERDYYKNDQLHINKRDFVIVHKDGILVKRIIEHNVGEHTITIHSLNPMYKDEVLNLADVRQVFSVVTSQRNRMR